MRMVKLNSRDGDGFTCWQRWLRGRKGTECDVDHTAKHEHVIDYVATQMEKRTKPLR